MSKKIVQIEVVECGCYYQFNNCYMIPKELCTVVYPVDHLQPEPTVKGYKIQVNALNIDSLFNWISTKRELDSNPLDIGDYVLSEPHLSMAIPIHYSTKYSGCLKYYEEVFTVEEFFSKVGYNPESKCNSSPKLIAKFESNELVYNEKLLIELWHKRNPCHEYSQEGKNRFWRTAFMVFEDYLKAVSNQNESKVSAPVQRKSLGVIDGKDVFEGDTIWWIDTDTLIIIPVKVDKDTSFVNADNEKEGYTKCYLSPKEADQRLKEEVEKVAKYHPVTCTWNQILGRCRGFHDLAIEAVEKEFNVKYLED